MELHENLLCLRDLEEGEHVWVVVPARGGVIEGGFEGFVHGRPDISQVSYTNGVLVVPTTSVFINYKDALKHGVNMLYAIVESGVGDDGHAKLLLELIGMFAIECCQ
jgi:hypothetical protein